MKQAPKKAHYYSASDLLSPSGGEASLSPLRQEARIDYS
jgi:hypothetical protein